MFVSKNDVADPLIEEATLRGLERYKNLGT